METIPFQGPPKFTQIFIFGMKIYYLASLAREAFKPKNVHSDD
jgi:hypothetical protein